MTSAAQPSTGLLPCHPAGEIWETSEKNEIRLGRREAGVHSIELVHLTHHEQLLSTLLIFRRVAVGEADRYLLLFFFVVCLRWGADRPTTIGVV